MISFIWLVFLYSPCMPIVFCLAAVDFFLIYWVDKILILRFYKRPKNYDETCLSFSLSQLKNAFYFHLVLGLIAFSNSRVFINKTDETAVEEESPSSDEIKWFQLSRYKDNHVLLFFWGMLAIILMSLFEE
mmetsp:Transcript_29381/g.44380  ORF Transcript_29381/g.44380 Transcript_29381/m.44380 type:complete len:131 (+) Transcript_29381:2788-3180(+)